MQHHEAAILTLLLNMNKNLRENEAQITLALFLQLLVRILEISNCYIQKLHILL